MPDVKDNDFLSESRNDKYLLEALMDNIPDAIYFKNDKHEFIKINKFVHLKGIKKVEDAYGKTDFDFFSEEHARQAFTDEEKIIQTGLPVINKIEKETYPDGTESFVTTTKAPLFGKDGKIVGIVGLSRDITDFVKKECEIKQSQEQYQNLIEQSPNTIAVVRKRKIMFLNSAGIQLMKVPDFESIKSKDIFDFFTESSLNSLEQLFSTDYVYEEPVKLNEVELRKYNGEIFIAEITMIPSVYSGLRAVELIIRDITSIKEQEIVQRVTLDILQASNSELTTDEFFMYIHNSVSLLMPAKNFYISLYDPKNEILTFPYIVDEVDGSVIPPQKFGKGLTEYIIRNGISLFIDNEGVKQLIEKGEVELIGSPSLSWLGVPLKIKDRVIGAMAVQDYHDINTYSEREKNILEIVAHSVSRAIERKDSDKEKERLFSELQKLNETKDKFFSFISHDLRSPFTSLLGFTDMMLSDFDVLPKEMLKQYIENISKTSKNLYNLLNELLQYSRFQTGHWQFSPVFIDLKELITDNISMLTGYALKKEVILKNEIQKSTVLFIDREMIGSVLQNLITNAIKFSYRQSYITVSAEYISENDHPFVEIAVTDNGTGMSEDTLKLLFTPDKAKSVSGTEKESGTGLGLILTKEFVERNGGRIYAKSTPGKGTSFKFTIPLKQ
jgi:PAS domain S-box-containing protein